MQKLKKLARLSPLPALVVVGLVGSACTTTNYAAKVGGTYISVSSLNNELSQLTSNPGFIAQVGTSQVYGAGSKSYSTKFVDEVLTRRIAMTIISKAVNKLGIALPASSPLGLLTAAQTYGGTSVFNKFSSSYRATLVADTAAVTALEGYLTHVNISLPSLQSYYHSNIAQFTEICSSRIVVATKAKANSIVSQVAAGASFATLAKTLSIDTATASSGGVLGCGTYANYVSTFGATIGNQVEKAAINVAQAPVSASGGYEIYMVTSRTPMTFNQALPSVLGTVFGSSGSADVDAFVAGVAAKEGVTVNPAYGSFVVSHSFAQVQAPATPKA